MFKIILPVVIAIGILITTIATKNKINKKYICDSLLICKDSTIIIYKLEKANKKVIKYKPVK